MYSALVSRLFFKRPDLPHYGSREYCNSCRVWCCSLQRPFLLLYHSFVSFISFVVGVWIVAFAMAAFVNVFRFFVGLKWPCRCCQRLIPFATYKQFCDDTKVGEMVIKKVEGAMEVLKADIEKAIVDAMALTKEIGEDCQA